MSNHLPLQNLSALVDGQAGLDEEAQIIAHLESCASCRAVLVGLRRATELVRALDPVAAPAGFVTGVHERLQAERNRQTWWRGFGLLPWPPAVRSPQRAALAAAVVILVGLFSINLWQQFAAPQAKVEQDVRAPAGAPFRTVGNPPTLREGEFGGVQRVGVPAAPGAAAPLPAGARAPFERQVIRTGDLAVEVANFEDAAKALVRIAEGAGGFIAESTTAQGDPPRGTFVLRVPAAHFAPTLERIEALGKVTERRVSGQDVTEEFVDLQARIRNLETHERQLLIFMERATRVPDLLAIEQELSRVRGEIEQSTGRLRFLANRVELAGIQVTLREKAKQSNLMFWDFTASLLRVRDAFLGTVRQLLAASERLLVILSAVAPLAVLALTGWGLIRWYLRRGASVV
jgi:hypothetical protein